LHVGDGCVVAVAVDDEGCLDRILSFEEKKSFRLVAV